jgi:hypothetical protein
MTDDYEAIRVVYRPVTDDLPDGSKHLGDEQTATLTDFTFDRRDGRIVGVTGTTDGGRDVTAPTPESGGATVRARDDDGTYNLHLGWVERLEGVKA